MFGRTADLWRVPCRWVATFHISNTADRDRSATGEQIIEQFGFKDRNTAKFTALLLVVLVIYRMLAYVAVRARVALL